MTACVRVPQAAWAPALDHVRGWWWWWLLRSVCGVSTHVPAAGLVTPGVAAPDRSPGARRHLARLTCCALRCNQLPCRVASLGLAWCMPSTSSAAAAAASAAPAWRRQAAWPLRRQPSHQAELPAKQGGSSPDPPPANTHLPSSLFQTGLPPGAPAADPAAAGGLAAAVRAVLQGSAARGGSLVCLGRGLFVGNGERAQPGLQRTLHRQLG